MKRAIYMAFTLMTALSIGGCSSAITSKDLSILEEAEVASQKSSNQSVAADTDQKSEEPALDIVHEAPEPTEPASDSDPIQISEEETEMEVELEGMKEILPTRVYTSDLGYQIHMDEQRFSYERIDGADVYKVLQVATSAYPDIFIKISKTDQTDDYNYLKAQEDSLKNANSKVEILDPVSLGTYDAVHYRSSFGDTTDSIIENVYIIEADQSYYTIETQYFLEAEEGYGARITSLLETFTFTEN